MRSKPSLADTKGHVIYRTKLQWSNPPIQLNWLEPKSFTCFRCRWTSKDSSDSNLIWYSVYIQHHFHAKSDHIPYCPISPTPNVYFIIPLWWLFGMSHNFELLFYLSLLFAVFQMTLYSSVYMLTGQIFYYKVNLFLAIIGIDSNLEGTRSWVCLPPLHFSHKD